MRFSSSLLVIGLAITASTATAEPLTVAPPTPTTNRLAELTTFLGTSARDNGTTAPSIEKLCEGWWETYWSCANALHDLRCGGSGGLDVFAQPACFDPRTYQDARMIKRVQIHAYLLYQANGCAAKNGGLDLPSPY